MARRAEFPVFLALAAGLHLLALAALEPRYGGGGGGARAARATVTGASPEIAALIEAWNTPPETGEAAELGPPAEEAPPPDAAAALAEAAVAAAAEVERLGAVSGPGAAPRRPVFAAMPRPRTDAPAQIALRAPEPESFATAALAQPGLGEPTLDAPMPGAGLGGALPGGAGLASPAPALSGPVAIYQPPEEDEPAETEAPAGAPLPPPLPPEEEAEDEAGEEPDRAALPEPEREPEAEAEAEPEPEPEAPSPEADAGPATGLAPEAAPLPRPRPDRAAAARRAPAPKPVVAPVAEARPARSLPPAEPRPEADAEANAPAQAAAPGDAAADRPGSAEAEAEAGAAGTGDGDGLSPGQRDRLAHAYGDAVRAAIERHKHYPERARLMGVQGEVRLWLEVSAATGRLAGSRVHRPSGHRLLDEAALAAALRAAPFPPAPEGLGGGRLSFVVPIRFRL